MSKALTYEGACHIKRLVELLTKLGLIRYSAASYKGELRLTKIVNTVGMDLYISMDGSPGETWHLKVTDDEEDDE